MILRRGKNKLLGRQLGKLKIWHYMLFFEVRFSRDCPGRINLYRIITMGNFLKRQRVSFFASRLPQIPPDYIPRDKTPSTKRDNLSL